MNCIIAWHCIIPIPNTIDDRALGNCGTFRNIPYLYLNGELLRRRTGIIRGLGNADLSIWICGIGKDVNRLALYRLLCQSGLIENLYRVCLGLRHAGCIRGQYMAVDFTRWILWNILRHALTADPIVPAIPILRHVIADRQCIGPGCGQCRQVGRYISGRCKSDATIGICRCAALG